MCAMLAGNRELARHLDGLEACVDKKLATHDEAIAATLSAIRELTKNPPVSRAYKRRSIGFTTDPD
jgi:hypothetical protein